MTPDLAKQALEALEAICDEQDARQGYASIEVYDNARAVIAALRSFVEAQNCWCRTCRPITMDDMRFVVCPDCGNKRCPKANNHRNACTGSNEPGQPGSAYAAAIGEQSHE